ncbi:MAG: TonB-dependent receptor, partial [Sphingobium sp.]
MSSFYRGSLRAVLLLASCSLPAIAQAGDLSGQVVDASGTRALRAAKVVVSELNRAVTTDRNGRYVMSGLPAGTYEVEAIYVGAEPVTQTVSVPETGRVTADFSVAAVGGNEILVVGLAANQASALSRQKAADGVSSVLTRDAIGQFPDQNVAESMRRLPGVNILNDQGEGRFVSIRGLDPELNSTSLNGVRLPAPESDVRSVALDVISSDIIESIEVKKSLTPDMDADTIGASIEINTTSAFDRKKDYYSANLEGSYNDYRDKVTPKGGLDFSTRLTEDFGIAGGISYYKRSFETDGIETGGWKTGDNGVDYTEEPEYRDYDVTRKRLSGALSFDFRASDTTTLYARGNYSQFDDQESRRRTIFVFDEEPTSGDENGAYFSDADGEIEIRRDIKDRFERQRIRTISVGGDTNTGDWKFSWQGSWAKSSERENFSLDPARFAAKFEGDGVGLDMDYSDPRQIFYNVTSGADLVNDPSLYEFDKLELTTLSDSKDEEWAAKADLSRIIAMDGGTFTVQGGVKSRWRKKSYDFNMTTYDGYDGSFTLADVLGKQTYRMTDLGPLPTHKGATDFFRDNRGNFEIDAFDSELNSLTADYSVKEDVLAGYLLGRWDSDTLRVIGGVRMERTWNELNGQYVIDDGDTVTSVVPAQFERHYTDWLPSLTLRFSPQNDMVFRLAGYKSLVRPKLSKMAPIFVVNEDNEADFGNPNLKPYEAWNFDAGWDYYFSGNGAISIGGFYKTIKNFIVDANYFDYEFEGALYEEFSTSINGGKAEILGIEASYSQVLDFLPSPLDGFLVQANYTYTYSKGDVLDEDMNWRTISLPSNSR